MFLDYESLVLQDYRRKKKANTLSHGLIYPTPAGLRQACIKALNYWYDKKDDKTLLDFFEPKGDATISEQTIRRFGRDKFKPLSNFLKKEGGATNHKNIELLAWLIDFEDRPYKLGKVYGPVNPGISEIEKKQPQSNDDQTTVVPPEKPGIISQPAVSGKPDFNFKTIALIASIIILVCVVVLIYWWEDNKSTGGKSIGQEKCMYWAGDHYQQVLCNSQKLGDTMVIAFDSVRLYNLKRITNPDTITQTAIGRVWYVKIDNKLEFYTSEGYHPINPRLRLKPITEYIINKYLKPGQKPE